MLRSLVGSEMCIRDSINAEYGDFPGKAMAGLAMALLVLLAPTAMAQVDVLDKSTYQSMLSGNSHLTESTLWRDPVLPLVPYDTEYSDSHRATMEIAEAWAEDAKSEAAQIAEEAKLLKDKLAGWTDGSFVYGARAQKSAAEAASACFEAIVTADKLAPRPEEERIKTEITLRDLVVKAVSQASEQIRGQVAKQAAEEAARQVSAEAAQEAGSAMGVVSPSVLASAQERLLDQILPGASKAAQDEAASTKAQGVCLLYTSDAADEEDSVDLGGRRIIKKKTTKNRKRK
eukprot:TRINITY_DN16847_c0_g1_i1.p1 TRINITY_DN16847_c0_g1~~TRINITY_DN16847_c0_g1_i1.p1  ORF type:complete len:288 (-),score=107.18 TRINITY_DN16847_c0_g1_i1:77-940(-)